jgi:hypothetical protein
MYAEGLSGLRLEGSVVEEYRDALCDMQASQAEGLSIFCPMNAALQ